MKHRLLLLLLFVFTTSVAGWAQKSVAPSYTIKGVLLDSIYLLFDNFQFTIQHYTIRRFTIHHPLPDYSTANSK